MLSAADQTGSIPSILSDLKSLEASYNALNIQDKIKNNKGSVALTDTVLLDITKVIEKLRENIVQ